MKVLGIPWSWSGEIRNKFQGVIRKFAAHRHENLTIMSAAGTEGKTKAFKDEILRLQSILSGMGYTWDDVAKHAPTHKDHVEKVKEMALYIAFQVGKCDGGKLNDALKKLIGENWKTMKKYRPYLYALAIVYIYDFPLLRSYLNRKVEPIDDGSQRDCR